MNVKNYSDASKELYQKAQDAGKELLAMKMQLHELEMSIRDKEAEHDYLRQTAEKLKSLVDSGVLK